MGKKEKVLTPRQLQFCQNMLNENSCVTTALMEAGYAEQYAKSSGHAMAKQPHVRAKIEELRKAVTNKLKAKALIQKEDLVKFFMGVMKDSETATRDSLKAADSLTKMYGFNEPDKLEVTAKLHYTEEQQIEMAIQLLLERGYEVIKPL